MGVVQFAPRAGDVDGNLERIARETAALAAQGCELIVFPELAVTGPVADREAAEALAEAIPGPITDGSAASRPRPRSLWSRA